MEAIQAKHDWIGKIVGGHFEIAEKLTDGSQSEVYWGRNLINGGADAAVKVVATTEQDPFVSERLHRQSSALQLIKDTPAAVKVVDRRFTEEGELVLILELLDGMTLQGMLERGNRRMDMAEVIELFPALIESLSCLHKQGVIHRNLHPGKIFRSWDPPGLKLLGLGDANFVGDGMAQQEARFLGLPKYVAPELWTGKGSMDERADVYSLAVILYRCLAGRCPFESESIVELVNVVPRATRPSLTDLVENLPAAMDDWAAIALAPRPDDRFLNVDAMWKAFVRASESPVETRFEEEEKREVG